MTDIDDDNYLDIDDDDRDYGFFLSNLLWDYRDFSLSLAKNASEGESDFLRQLAYQAYVLSAEISEEARWGGYISPENVQKAHDLFNANETLFDYSYFATERRRLSSNLKRAKDKDLLATLTLSECLMTLMHFNRLCAYCGRKAFTCIEHYIPVTRGGGTTYNNCVPACTECNQKKSRNNPDAYLPGLFPEYDRVRAYLDKL